MGKLAMWLLSDSKCYLVCLLVRILNNTMYCVFNGTLLLSFESFGNWEYKRSEVSILLTEKIYIFIFNRLIKIYILFMKPNRPYDGIYVLDNFISLIIFNYINDV
jgi:hypothetical protein